MELEIETKIKPGRQVNSQAFGDLVSGIALVTEGKTDSLVSEYEMLYDMAIDAIAAVRYQVKKEIAISKMFDREVYIAFRDTFRNLYGL